MKRKGQSLTRTYALGSFHTKDSENELYFANHLSLGFDACTAKKMSALPKWTAALRLNHLIHPLIFFVTAFTFKPFVLSYENGDDKRTFKNLVCVGFKSSLLWRRNEDCTECESAG